MFKLLWADICLPRPIDENGITEMEITGFSCWKIDISFNIYTDYVEEEFTTSPLYRMVRVA
jgi:hypothetical protein